MQSAEQASVLARLVSQLCLQFSPDYLTAREASRDTKAASMSSRRRMVLRGRSAILACRTVSVIEESERLRTEMPRPRWPARARIRLVLPQPGGP